MDCNDCILSKSEKHTEVRDDTLKIKEPYFQPSVKILFVAESPPFEFHHNRDKYFYSPGEMHRRGLFYAMMSVLFENDIKNIEKSTKDDFLRKFKEKKYYLIDMVKCPINKIKDKKEKAEIIRFCSKHLNSELSSIKYEMVIFIGKGSYKKIKKHLNIKPNVIPLPFHSEKNIINFKNELKKVLCQVRA